MPHIIFRGKEAVTVFVKSKLKVVNQVEQVEQEPLEVIKKIEKPVEKLVEKEDKTYNIDKDEFDRLSNEFNNFKDEELIDFALSFGWKQQDEYNLEEIICSLLK